ncbi:NAD-dependent glutamate dehydrogenase [Oleoguttula sp. CCFEE 5521]
MCVRPDGTVPAFYEEYVRQVQATIRENARLEFEVLWKEGEASGESRSILSDRLSVAITRMDEELQATELWDNVELRRSVLSDALPQLLLQQIGLEKIMERVPINYLKAIFGSFLASRFIYSMGISASPVSFFAFMNSRMSRSKAAINGQ